MVEAVRNEFNKQLKSIFPMEFGLNSEKRWIVLTQKAKEGRRQRHSYQMVIAIFLDCRHLAL